MSSHPLNEMNSSIQVIYGAQQHFDQSEHVLFGDSTDLPLAMVTWKQDAEAAQHLLVVAPVLQAVLDPTFRLFLQVQILLLVLAGIEKEMLLPYLHYLP
jgi:hypothetical protein